ncbi:MAG: hypothetical protein ABII02_02885 [Candidatus Magasanikbacteria bacterium]
MSILFLLESPAFWIKDASPIAILIFVILFSFLIAYSKKRNELQFILLGFPLTLGSSFFFLVAWGSATEAGNVFIPLLLSLACLVGLLLYYVRTVLGKTDKNKSYLLRILYLPLMYVFFIASMGSMMWMADSSERVIQIDVGENPYIPGEMHNPPVRMHVWNIGFWTGSISEEKEMQLVEEHKYARLIKHIGDEKAIGWDETMVKGAFNEPDRIIKTEGGETWLYRAWQNHPDWELPVYMKDGLLLKIGD